MTTADDLVMEARALADNAESDTWPTYFDVALTRRLADEVERLQDHLKHSASLLMEQGAEISRARDVIDELRRRDESASRVIERLRSGEAS